MTDAAAPTHKQTFVPVAAMLAAGIIHLLIAPQHMTHAPAHGLFFGFAGLMQVGWALEFRNTPSRQMAQAGMAMSGGLVLLWALTLLAGAPFAQTLDPIEWSAMTSKLAESTGAAALAVMVWRGRFAWEEPPVSRGRILAGGLGLAMAVCLVSYGLGRAAEPFLPGLAEGPGHPHSAGHDGPINGVIANGMLITSAWVRPPASASGSGAAYFSVTNLTGRDDTLLEVTTGVADSTQLIQTVTLAEPVSHIIPIDSLPIPAGGPLILAPGGVEVLLVGVSAPLAPGQTVPISLRFEGAGVVEINAEVVAAPTPGPTLIP